MDVNAKVALLLLGVLVGGVAGYVTRSPSIEIVRVGQQPGDSEPMPALPMPLKSPERSDGLLAQTSGRIFIFAAGGGIVGLLVGLAVGRL